MTACWTQSTWCQSLHCSDITMQVARSAVYGPTCTLSLVAVPDVGCSAVNAASSVNYAMNSCINPSILFGNTWEKDLRTGGGKLSSRSVFFWPLGRLSDIDGGKQKGERKHGRKRDEMNEKKIRNEEKRKIKKKKFKSDQVEHSWLSPGIINLNNTELYNKSG